MSEKLTALSWSGRWLTHTVPHCSNDGSLSVSESHFDETRRDATVAWRRNCNAVVRRSRNGLGRTISLTRCIRLPVLLLVCVFLSISVSVGLSLPLFRCLCLCTGTQPKSTACEAGEQSPLATWRFVVTWQSNNLHGFSVSRCRRRHLMAVTRPPRTTNSYTHRIVDFWSPRADAA